MSDEASELYPLTPGEYVNKVGATIVVTSRVALEQTLGNIWQAHAPDDLFPRAYLVTAEGLAWCGYRRVEAGDE